MLYHPTILPQVKLRASRTTNLCHWPLLLYGAERLLRATYLWSALRQLLLGIVLLLLNLRLTPLLLLGLAPLLLLRLTPLLLLGLPPRLIRFVCPSCPGYVPGGGVMPWLTCDPGGAMETGWACCC